MGSAKEALCLAGLGLWAVLLRSGGDVDTQNLLHLQWKLLRAEEGRMHEQVDIKIPLSSERLFSACLFVLKLLLYYVLMSNTSPCTESAAGKWPQLLVEYSAGPASSSTH